MTVSCPFLQTFLRGLRLGPGIRLDNELVVFFWQGFYVDGVLRDPWAAAGFGCALRIGDVHIIKPQPFADAIIHPSRRQRQGDGPIRQPVGNGGVTGLWGAGSHGLQDLPATGNAYQEFGTQGL